MKKNVFFKAALLLVVMLFSFMGKNSAQTWAWQQVDITKLADDDVFLIVDIASSCAMPTTNGSSSAPSAVSVTIVNDTIVSSTVTNYLKWNKSGNATDGYTFYPNGDNTKWLYCNVNANTASGSNNNMRVGTGEAQTFILYNGNWLAHVYSTSHTRYVGVYIDNNQVPQNWRGYTSTGPVSDTRTRFFKYAPLSSVATPVFSLAEGDYYTSRTVSITCETEGAEIRYTLDGSDPDANSTLYTEPIAINTTTTLKAIAYVGDASSRIAEATYTLPVVVENIAELRAQFTNNTMYRISGEVVVTFSGLDSNNNNRFYTYIQDETAGMLIYEQINNGTPIESALTSSLTKGDVISGFLGTATTYRGMLELTPIQLGELVGNDESRIDTLELALNDVSSDYQAQLVKVMNVTFATTGSFNSLAGNKANYYLVGSDDVVAQIRYRDNPLLDTEIPTTPQNLIALVYQYDEVIDLSLLGLEEYVPEPTDCENAPTMGTCTAVLDNRDMLFTGQIAVDDPACTIREYGFVYSTSSREPVIGGEDCTKEVSGTGAIEAGTDFSYRLASLGYNTYYVRAYAINEADTGYSDMVSILQAEPEIYAVDFLVNGHNGWTSVASMNITEGESIMKFPVVEDCGNLSFAGWALQPFEGTTTEFPALFNTFTPTSDTTFYAVFSNIQNAMNDEIVISRSSFPAGALQYANDDEWTAISKENGDVIQGIAALYSTESMTYIQIRSATHPHPYNVTALPGPISSITLFSNSKSLGSMDTREWIPWISSSPLTKENYNQTGIALDAYNLPASSSYTWNVDASLNANYFYLSMTSGSAYIDSIVIAYTSGEALYTMSAVDTVTIDQTICEGMTYEDEHFTTGIEGTHDALVINSDYCATQYILNLSLEARDTLRHYVDTCDTYTLNGQPYTNSEQVFVVTPAEDPYGCPVVDEWNITIRHSSEGDTAAIACNSYSWHDYTDLTESGDYTATLVNAEGCDSIVTLHLTINLSDTAHLYESICENDLPYHYENGEIDATFEIGTPALTTATYNLNTVNGCDSIVFLHLTVNPVPENHETVENCGPYRWNDSTYAVSGDYEKVFRLATGCDSTAYLHLTINYGDYTEVEVDTCGTEFHWELADTTVNRSGIYYYYSENANTCEDTTVLILSLHQAVTTEISAQICEGETYNKNGFNVSEARDYQLDLQTVYGCDSTVILHLTVGNAAITYLTPSICEGESYNENGFEINAPAVGVLEDSIVIERPGTCDSIVKLTLTVNALPKVTISGETSFCEDGNTVLTADGATTYTWGDETTAELTVNEAGTYTVTGTDANGCKNTATVEVTMNTLPTITISGETTFCEGGNTTLTAFGAETYTWGDNYNEAALTATAGGTYTVTGTDANGCANTATVEVTMNNLPTITISGETSFCEGGNTTLTADGATTYTWGDETTAELTVNEAGTYTVTGTDANGCVNTATVEVTMNTLPTITISGETTFCEGGNTMLTADGAVTYSWGDNNNEAALTATAGGTYTVTGTDANGCANTATVEVTKNTLPTITISGVTTFCEGGNTTLTADGAVTYSWGDNNNEAALTATTGGTYTVTGTDANGCANTATVEVTMNTLPTITISGETSFCEGGSTTLTADGATTYSWGEVTTAELAVNEAGTYTVTGTDANGCVNTATVEVTMNTLPTITISGDTSFCFGGSTVLTASGATTYTWGDETTAELAVTEAGTYTVTGTDANGCTNTASQEVTVVVINTEIGVLQDSSLAVSQENAEYQWIDCATNEPIEGATQQQFTPEVSGSYACVITLGECTDTTDCKEVAVSGISENGMVSLALYPNPTTGIVNIRLTPETCNLTPEIHVFDIYGKQLQVMRVSSEITEIDLSTYVTGVYLVKLVSNGKVIGVKKVVRSK